MTLSDFWAGKRVLITGHTGFKGSWLSLWLRMLGAEVLGYALQPTTEPSLFELASIHDYVTSIWGNIQDLDHLSDVVQSYQPEIVIHMAAQPIVHESYKNPVETYRTNVLGTVNLLESIRYVESIRSVVVVTSDKCYENRNWIWGYREDEALGGSDPYSSSKACTELVTAAYRDSFFNTDMYAKHGVAIASARAGNVIGGGDWSRDRLVPDILKSILAGQHVTIRNPLATRPWQHVLEPLHGYLMLAAKLYTDGPAYSGGWNLGPDDESVQPVARVVEMLLSLWGSTVGWVQDPADHPYEAHVLKLDSSKAHSELGWHARLDLSSALFWVTEWTKAWQSSDDMRCFTQAQIRQYMELGYS